MFLKIDERNKFLTKHSEDIIKRLEIEDEANPYKIFNDEEIKSLEKRKEDKKKFLFNRQISHGKSYKIIYIFFFFVGILGAAISAISFFCNNL